MTTGLRKGRALSILWAEVPAARLTVYEFAHPEVSRQPAWDRTRAQSVWRRRIERLWAHAPGSPGIYRRLAAR